MSLVKEILRLTARHHPLGYKQLYEYLYGKNGRLTKNSLSSTLSRLRSNGIISREGQKWVITPEGEELLHSSARDRSIPHFSLNYTKSKKPRMRKVIVVFDIPEKKRRYRDWLRSELVSFDFDLIQKSVWFGPSLPPEFIEYLDKEGLLKYVRFFRAEEKDLI